MLIATWKRDDDSEGRWIKYDSPYAALLGESEEAARALVVRSWPVSWWTSRDTGVDGALCKPAMRHRLSGST